MTGNVNIMKLTDFKWTHTSNETNYNIKKKYYNFETYCSHEYVRHYGCNMDHHHNKNFLNHWSELQKNQRLFI